jgi:hypothetical protein
MANLTLNTKGPYWLLFPEANPQHTPPVILHPKCSIVATTPAQTGTNGRSNRSQPASVTSHTLSV